MIDLVKILVFSLTQTLSAWGEGVFYLCIFFMSMLAECDQGSMCLLGSFAAWWYFAGKKLPAGAELSGLHLAEELLFGGGTTGGLPWACSLI